MPRSLAFALAAFMTLPNYAECAGQFHAHRHPVRNVVCHVPVVRQVVRCHCGDKCNCVDCCCDSRRVVQQAVAVVTFPIRAVGNCLGGCCK